MANLAIKEINQDSKLFIMYSYLLGIRDSYCENIIQRL